MSQLSRSALKGYWETNDYPTEAQFGYLIDSLLNFIDDGCVVGGEGGILAHVGGGQANAYQLSKLNNQIATVVNPGDSVRLLDGTAGMVQFIHNAGGNACDVFPYSGNYINALAVDTAISLAAGSSYTCRCYATGYWRVV